jgi:hypothetical protein
MLQAGCVHGVRHLDGDVTIGWCDAGLAQLFSLSPPGSLLHVLCSCKRRNIQNGEIPYRTCAEYAA